jgi:iron complex outermembrane recepter protein
MATLTPKPNLTGRLSRFSWHAFLVGTLAGLCATVASAQPTTTGAITGRVYNPVSHEYLRNVEIRIEGTQLTVASEDGGYYRLNNAPAGDATVVATYTGHETVTTHVTVPAGQTVVRDFEMIPSTDNVKAAPAAGETVKLEAFVVEAEKEGQAKAISEQKTAMNVKTVVASDNFGEIAEGNIGEFLKFMPGITLDYVETDTRAARMGGMEARYGYVTLDGSTMANTSTGSFGDDTRQFEFEAISIANIETVEVNKTLTADMPADAIGGTVNLRTKSALDRKGSFFSYNLGFIGNQYEHSFRATPRHDDSKHPKARPTATFDYSNSFFGNKLGVQLNTSFSNVFKEQFRHALTYDYTSGAARGTPLITAINFKDGPKMTEKSSGGMRLDYQPFRSLRLNLTSNYTYFSDEIANRNMNFRVSASNLDPTSNANRVVALPTTNANTRIEHSGSNGNKKTDTTNVSVGYRYREGRITSEGSFQYSRARQQNGSLHMGSVEQANLQLTRIGYIAERPNVSSPSWDFVQTSGGDWYDLNNYGKNDTQSNNITNTRSRSKGEQFVGKFNVKYVTSWSLPTFFQGGLQEDVTTRHREQIFANTSTYVGPTGNQLTSPMPASIAYFDVSAWGSNLGHMPVPDKHALFVLQRDHPEYFTNTLANQVSNLDSVLGSTQNNQEQIGAAFLQGNTRIHGWQLQAGVRGENTRVLTEVPTIVPNRRNPYPTGTLAYEYFRYSEGLTRNYGKYTTWVPSASAKYNITRDLNFKFGYNKGLKRPPLSRIAGAWSIDETNQIITIPNPELSPEFSEKMSAGIEYYSRNAGQLSVTVLQTDLNGGFDTTDPVPASEVGLGDDPVFGSYEFVTSVNIQGRRRIRSLELSWRRQLSFLPSYLSGTTVFANYTRHTSHSRPNNFVPQNASGGISYSYRKFNASLSGTWTDEVRTGSNTVRAALYPYDPEYLAARYIFDLQAGFKVTRHAQIYISGRNAFNSGKTWFYKSDSRIRQMERYGGQWVVGVKGNY